MPSLIARVVKAGSRLTIRHQPKSADALVRHLRRTMGNPPMVTLLPRGVTRAPFHEGNLKGDWLRVAKPRQVLLYLHGGGYVCGTPKTYHNLCGRLAKALEADVLMPAYRLAPEHPFPAAVDDALEAYDFLLRQGWRGDQISVAGDSAGGGLTLALLLALRDRKRPLPKCAVVYSPYADVTMAQPSRRYNDGKDDMLSYRMLEIGMDVYVQNGEHEHPYASPVYGDYTGLPPLFITVCEQEIFRDDAYRVADAARAAGVPVSLLARNDLLHVWPIFVPILPEAREDLEKVVRFIGAH